MNESDIQTVFLFGAGAEVPMGMPSGGRFALDVISSRYDGDIKETLKGAVQAVHEASRQDPLAYRDYSEWSGIGKRRANSVNAPDSRDQKSIFISTIENSRQTILQTIQECDEAITVACATHAVALPAPGENPAADGRNPLIQNAGALSRLIQSPAIWSLITLSNNDDSAGMYFWPVIRMYFELAIAVGGQDLAAQLNNLQVGDASTTQQIFQNANHLFHVDFGNLGLEALDIAVSRTFPNENTPDPSRPERFAALEIISGVMERIVDYQRLIERFLPALYKPVVSWAKFTKAAFLLYRMRSAIRSHVDEVDTQVPSYYTDIEQAGLVDNALFATTNYTDLILQSSRIPKDHVIWLNGHVDSLLDPYRNETIWQETGECESIRVPYMIAQSVVKPMMTPQSIEDYARFSKAVTKASQVVVVGYGFGAIDSHVNAVIRHAVESDDGPNVAIFVHQDDPAFADSLSTIKSRLRLNNNADRDRLAVYGVNDQRQVNGLSWMETVSTGRG